LREIKTTNWEVAQRLFLYVTVASRPLRVKELADFLAFDFTTGPIPKFRGNRCQEDPIKEVLSTCSTLLSLVDVDGSPVIQLSHLSVKEFLTSSRFADNISPHYQISMAAAHALVAQACLGVLLHLGENVTRDNLESLPVAQYAAEHWLDHARFEGMS
jgi:hypothetical protein